MKYEIKTISGSIVFSADAEILRDAVVAAIKHGASLSGASLSGANLFGASLSGANLSGANLFGASLSGANLPSPQIVLSAFWGSLSDQLTADLMEYDANSHPDRNAFQIWAEGGKCPYDSVKVQRAANFTENKTLWGLLWPIVHCTGFLHLFVLG
jgi:Pentapeptide repeats (8 copies)